MTRSPANRGLLRVKRRTRSMLADPPSPLGCGRPLGHRDPHHQRQLITIDELVGNLTQLIRMKPFMLILSPTHPPFAQERCGPAKNRRSQISLLPGQGPCPSIGVLELTSCKVGPDSVSRCRVGAVQI